MMLTTIGFKIKINEIEIKRSPPKSTLGVTLDDQRNFKSHMSNLCKKTSQKLTAVRRIFSYMDLPRCQVIRKVYMNSQFDYRPSVWMMHSQSINYKIKHIHERLLKIVYEGKLSTCENLLEKDKAVKIHFRNRKCLKSKIG